VHVDVMTVPQSLGKVEGFARRTQAAGFSGLLFTETGRTAYLNAAVASQAAPGLKLSTGVAVAFPRSPFVTAATAWELQEATDPKVDVAAVNPWMLRMAAEVADGVHVHPLGEPGYLTRHVVPNVAEGAAKSGRSVSDIALIVPVMTIVGDSDEERHKERELARVSMSFYGSTLNYAFIWDEAGFEGTTADHRRPHRDVRDRVDVGRPGRRADRQVRRNRNAHRAVQRARRSGALRAIRRRRATHRSPMTLRRCRAGMATA